MPRWKLVLEEYWKPAGCDEWPESIRFDVFDVAYNSGVSTAIKMVQRAAFAKFPMIPAMKSAIALKTGRKDWIHVRPPLVELSDEQRVALNEALDQADFVMPNAHQLA